MSTVGEHRALIQVAPRPPILGVPFDPNSTYAQDESSFDLRGYWQALYERRWMIIGIVAFATLAAVLYALVAKPVYQADLIIHVEEESTKAPTNILSEASSLFETKKTAIAEIELLRSRLVVSRALDNLQAYIDVQPKYLPVVGAWIAKLNDGRLSNPGLFGDGGYVWGAERAEVSLFEVPRVLQGRAFTLISLGRQRFRLVEANRLILEGDVGQPYRVGVAEGVVELKVESMSANPGARFVLRRMSRLSMTEAIQNALVISEQGKQSGIIEVRLQGDDPQRVHSILSEIGREYMRQNLARKTEEAEKSLAFLDRQLPALKRQIEQAEQRYNYFRNAHGTVDLTEEGRLSLEQAAAARARRTDAVRRKAELLVRYPERHPLVEAVDRERREIDAEIAGFDARIKSIPQLEQEQARLTRDIKVNSDLYAALSSTAQQLRLTALNRVSNVRLVDTPVVPEKPIKPRRSLIVVLAAVTSLFFGILLVLARKALAGGIDDPQKIERMLHARAVFATIPHSRNQEKLLRKAKRHGDALPLLADIMPEDPAVENLRIFRAAVHFSMPHFRNNIVMFTGPARGVGKSFITANFAVVMAASGKRVLLVDGDLRNGQLYHYFGVGRGMGLSSIILGKASIDDVIHKQVLENLDFVATGEVPPNHAELLFHPNFANFLKQTSPHYDVVLFDSPPVLLASEALVIGAHAGAVFVVARSSRTRKGELGESITRLNHAGIAVQGILFNDMAAQGSAYSAQSAAPVGAHGPLGYSPN